MFIHLSITNMFLVDKKDYCKRDGLTSVATNKPTRVVVVYYFILVVLHRLLQLLHLFVLGLALIVMTMTTEMGRMIVQQQQ